MNCQNFESMMDELARGALMDASVRESALAHTESCARCAVRLADERSLAAGLRTLAQTLKGAEAPARIEASLVAAFRARSEAPVLSAFATSVPGARAVQPLMFKQWSWRKTFGTAVVAAAAAVILLMLIPPIMRAPQTEESPGAVAGAVAGTEASREVAGTSTPTEEVRPQLPESFDASKLLGNASQVSPAAGIRRPSSTPRAVVNHSVAVPASYDSGGSSGLSPQDAGRRGSAESATETREITTDFIPVAHAGPLSSGDGGQVVRVELPRSALVSFGLPMNVERADERVKADVLVGNDGMARAIRFVR